MAITLANIILNANIVLGCISLALNIYVLAVLIFREKKFSKQSGDRKGAHLQR